MVVLTHHFIVCMSQSNDPNDQKIEKVSLSQIFQSPMMQHIKKLNELFSDLDQTTISECFRFIMDYGMLNDSYYLENLVFMLILVSPARLKHRNDFSRLFEFITNAVEDKEMLKLAIKSNLHAAQHFRSYYMVLDMFNMGYVDEFPFQPEDEKDPLAEIIRNDDVSGLQRYMAQHNISIDSRVKPYSHETFLILKTSPTLVQYAAFFGSVKCTKFLLVNNANLNIKSRIGNIEYTSMTFAISGGNPEIIRLFEQKGEQNNVGVFYPIAFLHDDIYDWMENTMQVKLSEQTIKSFFSMFFIHALKKLIIPKNLLFDLITLKENHYPTEFHKQLLGIMPTKYVCVLMDNAIFNGNISLVKLLIREQQINLGQKHNGETYYEIAARLKYHEILSLLLDCPISDINQLLHDTLINISKYDYSNLYSMLIRREDFPINYVFVRSGRNGQISAPIICSFIKFNINFDIIRTLVENPEIELNKKLIMVYKNDSNKQRYIEQDPLLTACVSKRYDVMKLLLSNDKIDVNNPGYFDGLTCPLLYSCVNNDIEATRLLLQHPRIDVNLKHFRVTPLIISIRNKSSKLFNMLLENPDIDINQVIYEHIELQDIESIKDIENCALLEAFRSGIDEYVNGLVHRPEIKKIDLDDFLKLATHTSINKRILQYIVKNLIK